MNVHRGCYSGLRGLIDLLLQIPVELRGLPAIEVGSCLGESTVVFSLFFDPIYSIDPFFDCDALNMRGHEIEGIYKETIKGRNIISVKKKSADAIYDVPGEVAMVYIDANHSYEAVKEDVCNYWPKVKVGGFMCGHDYGVNGESLVGRSQDGVINGVERAVRDTIGPADVTFMDSSWMIRKLK